MNEIIVDFVCGSCCYWRHENGSSSSAIVFYRERERERERERKSLTETKTGKQERSSYEIKKTDGKEQ